MGSKDNRLNAFVKDIPSCDLKGSFQVDNTRMFEFYTLSFLSVLHLFEFYALSLTISIITGRQKFPALLINDQ